MTTDYKDRSEAAEKLVQELADELEAYIDNEHKYRADYPDIMRKYERDMEIIYAADLEPWLDGYKRLAA